MKKTIGILAHVDAGKTTFSEQLLYYTKSIKAAGRVDHKNSYLDSHLIEQQRGITVFADQAEFIFEGHDYTLIDTPGHIDFSAEMERSLLALDGAILLLDGTDGVQGHTETIWALLKKHEIPTLIFANKMDQLNASQKMIERELQQKLTTKAISVRDWSSSFEEFALLNEETTEIYLEESYSEQQWIETMQARFMEREFFPILYGSALKGQGIEWALAVLNTLLVPHHEDGELQAVIYKIRHIEQNQLVAFLKIKRGSVHVRQVIQLANEAHKITQLRKYNGIKFIEVQQAVAGETVAVIGLKNARASMQIGREHYYEQELIPTMRAKVLTESSLHLKELLGYFKMLEVEEPLLGVEWLEEVQEINVKIMGKIQLEVLSQMFEERFGEIISFGEPTIIYKETIASTVKGYGHFEPLKHYAEVHLKMEPGVRGQGIQVTSICHANDLTKGDQNAIAHYLKLGGHHGIVTGSEITDLKITLVTGRAHQKHTEGGDFKEATLRALRQGLEQADNRLLEPFYAFTLKADIELLGKMMTDLKMLHAKVNPPEVNESQAIVTGTVPVSLFMDYPNQFAAYTNGKGSIQLQFSSYDDCHNPQEVIEKMAYNKDADPYYSSNSIFCEKGKGYAVRWQDAEAAMHCPII